VHEPLGCSPRQIAGVAEPWQDPARYEPARLTVHGLADSVGESWHDTRQHAVHRLPDASWWARCETNGVDFWRPSAVAIKKEECSLHELRQDSLQPYLGWPTPGPSEDRLGLKMRQAQAQGGHVDWVEWAQETKDARRLRSVSPKLRSRTRRVSPRCAGSCPNYGALGSHETIVWPPVASSREHSRPSRTFNMAELHGRLRGEFNRIALSETGGGGLPLAAPRALVITLLDSSMPDWLPAGAAERWWELRNRMALEPGDWVRRSELEAMLEDIQAVVDVEGESTTPIRSALQLRNTGVCAALVSLPRLDSAAGFREARRRVRACGQIALQHQLQLDGLAVPPSPGNNDLVLSLAEGNPLTRIARLAIGACEHPPGMEREQAALGHFQDAFLVALPEADDPLTNWPALHHRIIAARGVRSWESFDVLVLGIFGRDARAPLRAAEALKAAASQYATVSGWLRPAFFLRCYPRSNANVPHVHAVELSGRPEPPPWGEWDLPLEDAIQVFREEASALVDSHASHAEALATPDPTTFSGGTPVAHRANQWEELESALRSAKLRAWASNVEADRLHAEFSSARRGAEVAEGEAERLTALVHSMREVGTYPGDPASIAELRGSSIPSPPGTAFSREARSIERLEESVGLVRSKLPELQRKTRSAMDALQRHNLFGVAAPVGAAVPTAVEWMGKMADHDGGHAHGSRGHADGKGGGAGLPVAAAAPRAAGPAPQGPAVCPVCGQLLGSCPACGQTLPLGWSRGFDSSGMTRDE